MFFQMGKHGWLAVNRITSKIKPRKLSLEGQNREDILHFILLKIFTININIIFSRLTVISQGRDDGSCDCAHSTEDREELVAYFESAVSVMNVVYEGKRRP